VLKELQRNIYIKDTMRQQCVLKLVDSWYQILVSLILTFQTVSGIYRQSYIVFRIKIDAALNFCDVHLVIFLHIFLLNIYYHCRQIRQYYTHVGQCSV